MQWPWLISLLSNSARTQKNGLRLSKECCGSTTRFRGAQINRLQSSASNYKESPDGAFKLWDALPSTIQSHDESAAADWAFPKKTIEELIKVRDQLIPTDPVLKNLWLFNAHVDLPGFRKYKQYAEHEVALEAARTEAVRDIYGTSGVEGVWRLLSLAPDGRTVGHVSGKHALVTEEEARLPQSLLDADKNVAAFAASYVVASYYHRGEWNWVNSLGPSKWSSSEKSQLALYLPFEPKVWDWVEMQGEKAQAGYWSRARAWMASGTSQLSAEPSPDSLRRGGPLARSNL